MFLVIYLDPCVVTKVQSISLFERKLILKFLPICSPFFMLSVKWENTSASECRMDFSDILET